MPHPLYPMSMKGCSRVGSELSEQTYGSLTVRGDYEGLNYFRRAVIADWRANKRDLKARVLLLSFRITQLAMGSLTHPRKISYPLVALYRIFTELTFSVELRPRVRVGPGLIIYHGFGLVVNNDAVLGSNVALRHGVTIGHRREGGASPVIHDNVEFGAAACIIGPIHVGAGAKIGPHCVIMTDVQAGSVMTLAHEPKSVMRRSGTVGK